MADESIYKIEQAVKDIDKLRDALHKLEIDLSVISQKITDQYESISLQINAMMDQMREVHGKVEVIREEHIQKIGFGKALQFLKHPAVINVLFIAVLIVVSPDFIKNHFLK